MSVTKVIIGLILAMLVIIWLFPLATVLVVVLKSSHQYDTMFFWAIPGLGEGLSNALNNIFSSLTRAKLGKNLLNSLLYATSAGIGSAFLASLAGYALAHLNIRGRLGWFFAIFVGNFFPFQMFLIPLYLFLTSLGLYDTRIGFIMIYTGICVPFALLVFRNYALTLSPEVFEAAKMDGCSDLRMYWNIFLPLSSAAFVVVFIFQFTWTWNDLIFGLVLGERVRPIMTALSKLQGYRGGVSQPVLLAGSIIASLPTVVILLTLQRFFVKGLILHTAGRG